MEHGVEILAHEHAFPELLLHLLFAERLEHHESNGTVESGSVQPAWKKSLAHNGGEVSSLDVKHVGRGIDSAGEVS